ncbi:hypothetical protein J437_LFUL004614 [Ladona fulva]|uniref:28S ribosomal protein S30, mitochondrial n=1 Tax=Ladona fulva TaxID=123851 RepID=A0A8K0JZI6_LADFU|nr:hypothetical protein J437_LFUL004614 [Ladona fulva]
MKKKKVASKIMELINMNLHKNLSFIRNNIVFARKFLRNFCQSRSGGAVTYPEIEDTSYLPTKQRERKKWHEKIKSLSTVEEKLIEVNMPSYYGFRCVDLSEGVIPYDSLNFTQSITRTYFIEEADVQEENPAGVSTKKTSQVFDKLKPLVIDSLIFHHESRIASEDDQEPVSSLVKNLNTLIMAHLAKDAPHLMEAEVDYHPRLEAYWVAGGMEPTYMTRKAKKNFAFMKEYADLPEDRHIQYVGNPILQLRHAEPLPPRSEFDTSKNVDQDIPFFKYDPRVLGLSLNRRHGINIPGFWPGDPCEHSLISYHLCNHLRDRPKVYGSEEHAEALHCQAILASYGWLLPLACYQGFSPFNDVTYPLLTQTVLTDGQFWSFYSYQMNSNKMNSVDDTHKPRHNMCWGTRSLKLFEGVEDGKVIGMYRVLELLLNMYLNKPCKRDVEMKPYLGEQQHVADIDDEERRVWLESRFKHLYSLRPRHRPMPEVYHWEKIYKIDHKTRLLEPKRRPFELGVNPFKKRLDEHHPAYIPKAKRTNKKEKWEKTYYP